MSCKAVRAAAVLLGGLRRVNSGVPIRVSAVITPNRSCGLSRSLITLSRCALAMAATMARWAADTCAVQESRVWA